MKTHTIFFGSIAFLTLGSLAGCSSKSTKSPDVTDMIRRNLDQATLKDVTISQDRDKGVVTIGGYVGNYADKAQAETIAKSDAAGQVVADEIAIVPPGVERQARVVNADLDAGIEKKMDAAFIQSDLKKSVSFDVKNGIVTLTGDVDSQNRRARAESVASQVPNVQQVVNELNVKDQKATSRN
jgi:hyperosmotically inducible periplasmic protein